MKPSIDSLLVKERSTAILAGYSFAGWKCCVKASFGGEGRGAVSLTQACPPIAAFPNLWVMTRKRVAGTRGSQGRGQASDSDTHPPLVMQHLDLGSFR